MAHRQQNPARNVGVKLIIFSRDRRESLPSVAELSGTSRLNEAGN
jgi:hypothetical protein